MQNGKEYLLSVDGSNFTDDDKPKEGGQGTIFDWEGHESFQVNIELGTNLGHPSIHVRAISTNGYREDNLAGSRIRYKMANGDSASRAVLGIRQLGV